MLRELPWKTFQEWMYYDLGDPIGARRADWQAAAICAASMNAAAKIVSSLTGKRPRKLFRPVDFLLEFSEEGKAATPGGPRKSWQEMKMIAMMFAAPDAKK